MATGAPRRVPRRIYLVRRAVVAGVLALVVVGGVVLFGSTGGGRAPNRGTPSSGTGGTAQRGSSPRSATRQPILGVGTVTMTFTDQVGTEPGGIRQLPTVIRYPSSRPTAPLGAPGAPADVGAGPFPLIVFSQGYDLDPESYAGLLAAWAEHGYVVADPTYPDTAPGPGLDEADIVNHPRDLVTVIDGVTAAASGRANPLSGLLAAGAVGLAGHSDGGDVSLAVAANSCCRDGRVGAVAVLSGAELAAFGGRYYAGPAVPLLVVQGGADTVNVPGCSVALYDGAPGPKYYLDLPGAGHEGPYLAAGTDQGVVARTTADFFDLYLKRRDSAGARLVADGTVPGSASLTAAAQAPLPRGSCPGS